MLGQLSVYIKQTRDDFMQRTSSGGRGAPKGKNLPETVNSILWVRQLEAKVGRLVRWVSDAGVLTAVENVWWNT